ncbi:MAG: bifunctional methylenetetrahydrofolate dehydrogenase/methenyltetrahydrofolate cyclohydrolase FolD [Legionellaceae bacterium]|nr:bifunctional methylenetetrahydrofolate dehydrogenase/methenyltetrahydrofolate cyclohydrolase FolD [Legionellaceae bacterium]HAF87900.1 bifunctional methylenetetrahydrofolate dehydrogenase/methenyltetrahydrofolate cyclohydrolase FolD [Legionellales bacterium]HCA89037.1 bifunctional methylenetetrahydrofolate dehydrogenase/methenyltetrahydrofolate cyclohydrolase FolD [Legionellales bacterium]|tara:strand:+ start:158 stop:1003 length:846 start_codon:yes stop_codon:yes gene_type:complete
MTALLLDGQKVAQAIKLNLTQKIAQLTQVKPPELVVILVGEDTASQIYVKNKRKSCHDIGMVSHAVDLPFHTSTAELLTIIDAHNTNPAISGILVQLPLPAHINSSEIIERIAPLKDVDGFHPYNLGRLAQRHPLLRPCTPFGIMQLLEAYGQPVTGRHAVVVGASNIVGRPMALEFLLAGATVTVCHRLTHDLKQHIKAADIVVSAAGAFNILNPQWFNAHQIVIDVGIHRTNNTLHGDIDFHALKNRVSAITPVPGGVGPMTIATLLQNTWQAYHLLKA